MVDNIERGEIPRPALFIKIMLWLGVIDTFTWAEMEPYTKGERK